MRRSLNAASRCATRLLAGAVLAGQAAQAGVVVLENQLPLAASCVVDTSFVADFDANGLGKLHEVQLLDTQLAPGSTHVVPAVPGQLPVQLRFDRDGAPYTASPPFIDLGLRCRVGEHEHAVLFVNPDFRDGEGVVRSADSASSPTSNSAPARGTAPHALPSYTPTDRTGFVARLVPEHEETTATQLLAGAPVAVELSAMPLLGNGAPLRDAPHWIGRFKMASAPLADDVTRSDPALSGAATAEGRSPPF